MNCFEWQSRASDYLDCTLIGPQKREADEHLDGCQDCSERYKHYRVILTSLAAQPRSVLPVPIRKAPFTAALPKRRRRKLSREHWLRVPWYIRSTIEGVGVVGLILIGISAAPKIRAFYEERIERSLGEYNDPGELPAGPVAQPFTTAGAPYPGPYNPANPDALALAQTTSDAFSGEAESAGGEEGDEGDGEDASGASAEAIHARKAEIWRFNLKTDSPQDFRAKVQAILTELKLSGTQGMEVPGGIQFDLLVSPTLVPEIKRRLEKIAPQHATLEGAAGEPFSWFKSKSRAKLPEGKTRVVIWLSQL